MDAAEEAGFRALPHHLIDASSRYTNLFDQSTPRTSLQRSWYWEVNDLTQAPSGANKYLPKGVVTSNSDFSPATLEWTFTGKRKLMPTLDLTLVKMKPGEGTVRDGPNAQTGTAGSSRGSLWDRATQSQISCTPNDGSLTGGRMLLAVVIAIGDNTILRE